MARKKIEAPAKRGPGRPPRLPGETMVLVPIRMSEGERDEVRALAAAQGTDVSSLVRALLGLAPAAAPARPVATPEEHAAPTVASSVTGARGTPRRSRKADRDAKPAKRTKATTNASKGRR